MDYFFVHPSLYNIFIMHTHTINGPIPTGTGSQFCAIQFPNLASPADIGSQNSATNIATPRIITTT